jgi:hypothetical protein
MFELLRRSWDADAPKKAVTDVIAACLSVIP